VYTAWEINTGVAEWTPTFLKVTGKGVVGVGRRRRWQQFGWISPVKVG